jgi:hypothetical protein
MKLLSVRIASRRLYCNVLSAGISCRPYGTARLILMLTQDCAALVLGYYQYSLREKNVGCFIFLWVGGGGGGPT